MMLFDMTNEVSQIFIAFWELSRIWNNGALCGLEKYRKKLDESTACRQLKSPRSLSGRSLHLTLVTKWSRSHMTLKIQISRSWPRSNPLSNLRPRVQIDMFAFCLVAIGKFKVKVKANVKSDGYIWGLEFNRCVRFSFRGNRTIFCWDIFNSILDLENSRSRSWPRSNPMVPFEA